MIQGTGAPAYRRPAHVAYVVDVGADRTVVLLHLPTGRRVTLSATATAIWLAVAAAGDRGVHVDDLAPTLAARYGADPGEVAADVRRLLEQLADEDLVETTDGLDAEPPTRTGGG